MMLAIVGHVRGHRSFAEPFQSDGEKSWLWKLDARAKLIGVASFVVATALLTKQELIIVAGAIAVCFAALSGVPGVRLAKAYAGALPFILIACVSVFLVSGLERGLELFARTSSCVIALLVMVMGTETFDLFSGMRRLRIPAVITTLLMLTYKYVLMISEELSRMTVARKARGFSGGSSLLDRRALSILSFTAGMVFVRSAERAERSFEGLMARGFDREMRPWRKTTLGSAEAAFMAWFLVISTLLVISQLEVLI